MTARQYNLDLSEVGVVLLEPTSHVRVIREILRSIGFRHLTECRGVDETLDVLTKHTPDLLILDLDVNPGRISKIIDDVREGRLGANPFVVVVVTTWERTEDTVRSILNAGADDVVAKPLSVKLLGERIEKQIRDRKGFVATATYVGPDRRLTPRPGGDGLKPVVVPNSLRYKAIGDQTAICDREAIRLARLSVGMQRLQRMANDLGRTATHWERVAREAGLAPTSEAISEAETLAGEIAQYAQLHQLHQLKDLLASLKALLVTIRGLEKPAPRKYEILRLHSQALLAALLDGDDAPALLTDALKQAVSISDSLETSGLQ